MTERGKRGRHDRHEFLRESAESGNKIRGQGGQGSVRGLQSVKWRLVFLIEQGSDQTYCLNRRFYNFQTGMEVSLTLREKKALYVRTHSSKYTWPSIRFYSTSYYEVL